MDTRLLVPDDWEVFEHASGRILAIAERGSNSGLFRTNFALTVDGATSSDVVGDEQRFDEEFRAYQVIDLEPFELDGGHGLHRLAQYVTADALPLTMEQWCIGPYTLTATVETLRYDDYADLFEQVVNTWSLEPTGSGTDRNEGDGD